MSKPGDFGDIFRNSPAMQSIQQIQDQQREFQRERDRMMDAIDEANEQKRIEEQQRVEREQITADATVAVAAWAVEQSEENRRLRILTNVLAFAVIYDVVNGSFDDHTWWTTLISLAVGGAVLGGSLVLGKVLRHRRQAARDEDSGSPA